MKKIWQASIGLMTLFILLFAVSSYANPLPLPETEAFAFTVVVDNPNQVTAQWNIAPGYYLYAKRLHLSIRPPIAADITYPQGELKYDQTHGQYEVYSGSISIPVKLSNAANQINLVADYQGCSEDGFCYPPQHREMALNLTSGAGNSVAAADPQQVTSLLTNQGSVQSLLYGKNIGVILLIFAALGVLLSFTPCVLPMIPILTSIIIGHGKKITTRHAFLLSLTYILGSALTYAAAGVLAASMGHSLQAWLQQPWIITFVSALFALLALSLFGVFNIKLPVQLETNLHLLSNKQKGGSYIGVFLMGILSSLIVSPCVTAPLVGVLIYIGQTGNVIFGASALFVMGLGMGLPLLLVGMSAGKWLPRRGPWMEGVKKSFGLLMLGMGIWLQSRILSPVIMLTLWGIYTLIIAGFIGFYLARLCDERIITRTIAAMLALLSSLLIVGPNHLPNFLQTRVQAVMSGETSSTITVTDLTALSVELAKAKAAKKPVMIDFYADWCESCLALEKNVLASPDIQAALSPVILIRADLTANTDDEQAMMAKYDVIAPPTLVFLNTQGIEAKPARIVGEVDKNEFLQRLKLAGIINE